MDANFQELMMRHAQQERGGQGAEVTVPDKYVSYWLAKR
jgi:hypothetical protein